MTTPSSKTPVSIVNEYFTRKGCSPKFELVLNGCGTHNPTFAYILECEGVEFKALGKGRSKQEAKHEAAKKMLLYLDNSLKDEYEDVKELVLPHENSIPYNAVGELMEFCKKECYPNATFHGGGDVGLPHEKIFTCKCCVSQLTTVGEARTKKQAKQIAAHKMLIQLQLEAGEKPLSVAIPSFLKKEDIKPPNVFDYGKSTSVYKPHALLYKDFCNAYVGLPEKSETLSKILSGELHASASNSCQLVLKISEELGIGVTVNKINSNGSFTEIPRKDLISVSPDQSPAQDEINNENNDDAIFLTLCLNPPLVSTEKTLTGVFLDLLDFSFVQINSDCPIIKQGQYFSSLLQPILLFRFM